MIVYFFIIIFMIIPFVLIFKTDESISHNLLFGLFLIPVFWGIIILFLNKKNRIKEEKNKKLLYFTTINIILLLISLTIFFIIKNTVKINYPGDEKNLLKSIIKLSDGKISNRPIMVKKYGKWGFIDELGNVIVDYMYDDGMEFTSLYNLDDNTKYFYTPVILGKELRIINEENKILASYKTNKMLDCIRIWPDINEQFYKDADLLGIKINSNLNEPAKNPDLLPVKEKKYQYLIGEESNNILTFEKNDDSYDPIYKLCINKLNNEATFNGKKIKANVEICIEDENLIKVYNNGYIPFYNFEEKIFGWIDLNGEEHYLNGKLQILDFVDNYILVKDYSEADNEKVYFIDSNKNVVSDVYKEISIFPDGYIVKKENGKNVYINKKFKEITEEYDIIDGCRIDVGVLIVANLPSEIQFGDDYMPSNIDYKLINIETNKIISDGFEYINGMKSTVYGAKKYNNISHNEYIEILCNADSDFLNENLYIKNYK